jgi:hypothetical protein
MNNVSVAVKRPVIQYLSYSDWCKKEQLPHDQFSKAIYDHWKSSIPKLQRIIDDIADGHLSSAHTNLGRYIAAFRPDRFMTEQLKQNEGERTL